MKLVTLQMVFKRQRDLLDHGRVHAGHKLIKCNICDKDFTERGLLWHTERFHKGVSSTYLISLIFEDPFVLDIILFTFDLVINVFIMLSI